MATSGTVAYEAINEITGHRYVGVTVKGLDGRRRRHLSDARCGSQLRFHRAIRKYGEEAFRFTVIADFDGDFDLALAFEAEEIAKTKPRYNTDAGGRGRAGYTASSATRAKMRAAKLGKPNLHAKGKKRPPETIAKISAALKGRPAPNRGQPVRDETKAKLSAVMTGRKHARTTDREALNAADNMRRAASDRRKPVICLNDGKVFDGAVDAAKFYSVNARAVAGAASGTRPRKSVNGLRFAYVGGENSN